MKIMFAAACFFVTMWLVACCWTAPKEGSKRTEAELRSIITGNFDVWEESKTIALRCGCSAPQTNEWEAIDELEERFGYCYLGN